MEKVPYMLVIGDREKEIGTLAPRHRSGKALDSMTPADFVRFIQDECRQYH
jgi:threonyl-tRNA synthetase